MRPRSAKRTSGDLPPQLWRSATRDVGLSHAGIATIVAVAVLAVFGWFVAIALYDRAVASERHVALFASEGVTVEAEVVDVRRRGDGDDSRSIVDYRYLAGNRELTGTATLRGPDRNRFPIGTGLNVRYLASDPESSWPEHAGPTREPYWPAMLLPAICVLAVLGVALLVNREADLLANGRFTQATVTKVVKKQGQHAAWRVTYQWRLLSGAIRSAAYDHGKKQPPVVGAPIPLLYDRDQPTRQRIYPFSLVKLKIR